MAKIVGRNAKILYNGSELPQSNSITISYDTDYTEARVFADDSFGGPWKDQIPGFKGWKVDLACFYDDADDAALHSMASNDPIFIVLYESRSTDTRYWYGNAFFTVNEDINTNDIVTMKLSGMGTGPLGRIPTPS